MRRRQMHNVARMIMIFFTAAVLYSCADDETTRRIEGRREIPPVHLGGRCVRMLVNPPLVYALYAKTGLQILEISDLTNPRFLQTVYMEEMASDLTLEGSRLYVAGGEAGLYVYDVIKPEKPVLLGRFQTGFSCTAVAVRSNMALVSDVKQGLLVMDVSDPANIRMLHSFGPEGACFAIRFQGSWAFAANVEHGLLVADVSEPSKARVVCTVPLIRPSDIVVRGNLAYVGRHFTDEGKPGGITVVDVSDPAKARVMSEHALHGDVMAMDILHDRLVMVQQSYGSHANRLIGFPFHDDGSLVPDITADLPGFAYDVQAMDNRLWVSGGKLGLHVYEEPVARRWTLMTTVAGGVHSVTRHGKQIFVAALQAGILVLDAEKKASPVHVQTLDTDGAVLHCAVTKRCLVAADGSAGVKAFVRGADGQYILSGRLLLDGVCASVAIKGDFALVASRQAGLYCVTISDPGNLRLAGTLPITGGARNVVVSDGLIYLAAGRHGLWIVDMNENGIMTIKNKLKLPGEARDVSVAGRMAYVACWGTGLRIVDVRNPGRAASIGDGVCYLPGTDKAYPLVRQYRFVDVCGDYAYVASPTRVDIIDISDPEHQILNNTIRSGKGQFGLNVGNGIAYLASDQGLLIYR